VKVPASLRRHAVERVPEALREQLFQLVAHEAARTPAGGAAANSGFFERIGGSFRRLFA
jgi:hypothetical protein